jgi:Flp pilus assembly protein TadB
MTAMLLLGAGFGAGLWALLVGVFPPRPPLAAALAALRARPAPPPIVAGEQVGWTARAGRPFAAGLAALGLPRASVRRDLAVLGRPAAQHLAEQAAAALVGLLLAPAVAALLAVAGASLPLAVPLWGSLLLAVAGFATPDLGVRADAAKRRASFRHALSAYLDLVVIALAGGAGVDGALADAAKVGSGWAYQQIRRALDTAELARLPPWDTLGQLGAELGVSELSELAASVSLAGTEGARVRASLAAKAAALRAHALSDAEADAQAATERMSLPVVGLFTAFLVFIGYPALAHVLSSL